ncbi:MAG: hypothetical protein EXR79_04385 [Myxococcales bacterium]|nr:hypothetical protein [Myxococcales bacterium]
MAHADTPTDIPVAAERDPAEIAVTPLLAPVRARRVVRADPADLWLVTDTDFDRVVALAQKWVSARRPLDGGLRLERFTFLEPDRSYVLELAGGARPARLRLSRHLDGALLELQQVGDPREAPRWAPPWRPPPVVLWHGPVR